MSTEAMRRAGTAPARITQTSFALMYWTVAQMIAHHTSNGCNLVAGDLIGSGTVSGPEKSSWGSLLELTARGREPLALPGGEKRGFIEDGDEIIFRGYCAKDRLCPHRLRRMPRGGVAGWINYASPRAEGNRLMNGRFWSSCRELGEERTHCGLPKTDANDR